MGTAWNSAEVVAEHGVLALRFYLSGCYESGKEGQLAGLIASTIFIGNTRQKRLAWLAVFPEGSIRWPLPFAEWYEAYSAQRRALRLTQHETLLDLLIECVGSHAIRLADLAANESRSRYTCFAVFRADCTSPAQCLADNRLVSGKPADLLQRVLRCRELPCRCDVMRIDQVGLGRLGLALNQVRN